MPAMTYSRAGRTTIGPGCLSAVFGMGTGVSTRAWSPAISVRGCSPGGEGAPACTGGTVVMRGVCRVCSNYNVWFTEARVSPGVRGEGRCGQTVGC
jgi:hypothetical protein